MAYIYELHRFYGRPPRLAIANRADHRLLVSTQFALREWLLLGLSYRYSSRLRIVMASAGEDGASLPATRSC